jgi:hypothetical protein
LADGKIRVTLNGSLERPEVRRELARALNRYGIDVRFLLVPGPARRAGRVLSKDHTQPLGEVTFDTSAIKSGYTSGIKPGEVTIFIGVGVTGHGQTVEVEP